MNQGEKSKRKHGRNPLASKAIVGFLTLAILLGGFLAPFRMDVQPSNIETNSSGFYIVLEKNLAEAQTDPNDFKKSDNVLPECGFFSGGGATFMGCIALLGYYGLFVPTAFLLGLLGQFLDYTLAYTIDSNSYSGTSFVSEGWRITRDLSNILFIFVLLFVAIRTILGLGKEGETKKLIGTVIVIALLINFSLFFAKVVIDSSNILARVFYNAIVLENQEEGPSGEKAISVAIASKFDPQNLFDGVQDGIKVTEDGEPAVLDGTAYAGYFLLVSLIAAGINIVALWVFFVVAILFIARTLGLWLVMVFAPFAFISYIIPKIDVGEGLSGFGHQKWWAELLSLSFLAPIFIFFLYLIVMFLETDFMKDIFSGGTTIQTMLGIIIPLSIIVMLLIKAKDIAKKMAGAAGEMTLKAAKMVGAAALGGAALAGGAALGAGAMAGRAGARVGAAGLRRAGAAGRGAGRMTRQPLRFGIGTMGGRRPPGAPPAPGGPPPGGGGPTPTRFGIGTMGGRRPPGAPPAPGGPPPPTRFGIKGMRPPLTLKERAARWATKIKRDIKGAPIKVKEWAKEKKGEIAERARKAPAQVKEWAKDSLAKGAVSTADFLEKQSFDPRNTKLMKMADSKIKNFTKQQLGIEIGLGTPSKRNAKSARKEGDLISQARSETGIRNIKDALKEFIYTQKASLAVERDELKEIRKDYAIKVKTGTSKPEDKARYMSKFMDVQKQEEYVNFAETALKKRKGEEKEEKSE